MKKFWIGDFGLTSQLKLGDWSNRLRSRLIVYFGF
jgi:hypothetical protein